jgi:hypothetical protein
MKRAIKGYTKRFFLVNWSGPFFPAGPANDATSIDKRDFVHQSSFGAPKARQCWQVRNTPVRPWSTSSDAVVLTDILLTVQHDTLAGTVLCCPTGIERMMTIGM